MNKPSVLQVKGLMKTYMQGENNLPVLRGVDLTLHAGEIVALMGESGSGKSTLLQIIGLLDRADGGEIVLGDKMAAHLSEFARTDMRREKLGFIYQFHHLLPEFTARENIMMPMLIAGHNESLAGVEADRLLAEVELTHRASHRPAELSGGEQQRIAIARAFTNKPMLVLADEPTGNLDPKTADHVFEWFLNLCRKHGCTLLMATHNPQLAARADRTLKMNEGLVIR